MTVHPFTAVPFELDFFFYRLAFQTKNAWKFPGGLSDPGENIGESQHSNKRIQYIRPKPSFLL